MAYRHYVTHDLAIFQVLPAYLIIHSQITWELEVT